MPRLDVKPIPIRRCARAKCRKQFSPDADDKRWCPDCRSEAAVKARYGVGRESKQIITARRRMLDRRDRTIDPGFARRLDDGHELLGFGEEDDDETWWWFLYWGTPGGR